MGPDVHESLLTNKRDFQRIRARNREAGVKARARGASEKGTVLGQGQVKWEDTPSSQTSHKKRRARYRRAPIE